MIAAAHNCGCPLKSGIAFIKSLAPLESKSDSVKCVRPGPNDPKFKKTNDNCNPCCEAETEYTSENNNINQNRKSKVISEIVEKGLPYKEIEAIINNNRLAIRVQKASSQKNEWDPPCDCNEDSETPLSKGKSNLSQNSNNVIFRKVDLNQCNQNPCRNITVYPQPDSEVNPDPNTKKSLSENEDASKLTNDVKDETTPANQKKNIPPKLKIRSIDLEENPNIFLLRIKKICKNGDGKYNIDLEFRAPRPWLPKPPDKKPIPPPQVEQSENKREENITKNKKGKKDKKSKKGKK